MDWNLQKVSKADWWLLVLGVTNHDLVPLCWKDCNVCAIALSKKKETTHKKEGRQEYAERFIDILFQREKIALTVQMGPSTCCESTANTFFI